MTAPYEKAKLAGYTVEPDFDNVGGWRALDPAGEELSAAEFPPVPGVQRETFPTEGAAWEACDRHRMFGDVRGAQAEGAMERDGEGFDALHDPRFDEPAAPKTLDTRRVLCASTAHLTLATCKMLSETPLKDWPVYGGAIPDGFYVSAGLRWENPNAPADLLAVMHHAHGLGFDYVQFDTDADQLEGLKVYQHEPQIPYSYEGRGDHLAIIRTEDDAEVARVMAGADLEAAQAQAQTICDLLTGVENLKRYDDQLNAWELSPNGDDYNVICAIAQGAPYVRPIKGGR